MDWHLSNGVFYVPADIGEINFEPLPLVLGYKNKKELLCLNFC